MNAASRSLRADVAVQAQGTRRARLSSRRCSAVLPSALRTARPAAAPVPFRHVGIGPIFLRLTESLIGAAHQLAQTVWIYRMKPFDIPVVISNIILILYELIVPYDFVKG